ncbi:polysaccharide deacetylase family protein [Streptomyces mutabilis]|uniref:polysaccharide deacetylase family protein n=1 Tax=Streptomyces mutabilis TaxID=67332 RepID=UPI0022BA1E54|nr:polysaccharide deacetylase family protein [Streptomyces mutabilis]MCZ9352042.1 polysaccharide deacetylase family protein [Streptomyces mutabilis]
MSRARKHSASAAAERDSRAKVGRRSALGLMGLGGLLTAGGVAAGVAGKDLILPASAESGTGAVDLGVGGRLENLTPPTYAPTGRRPRYRRATWSEQFQDGHEWSPGGEGVASAGADTEVFTRGDRSCRVTTRGDGVQSFVRRTGMEPIDLKGKMIRLVFQVEDVAHLDRMEFYVGTRELANHFSWTFHYHSAEGTNYVQSGDWVTVHLQWADVTGADGTRKLSSRGEPSVRSGFTDMSFAVYDDGKGPVTYRLQAVEVVPDTTDVFPKGVVSITFDDSHESVHGLARPVMDRYGMPGTLYNIAGAIGTEPFMGIGQMRSLQDSSGWEMAGHAYSLEAHDASYPELAAEEVDEDFRKLREWLVGHGFTSEHFAYPHGAFGKTRDGVPVDLLAARHFTTARSIISETTESFAPAMPYRLKALTGINDGKKIGGETLADVIEAGGALDRCARGGDWLILCLHRIVEGVPTQNTELSTEGLDRLMREIDKRGIEVLTVQEAMAYYA